jgi:hypothetical protein
MADDGTTGASKNDPDALTMKEVHDDLKKNFGWTDEDIAAFPALNDLRKFTS